MSDEDRVEFMKSDFAQYLKTEVDFEKHIPFNFIAEWIHDRGYLDNLMNRLCLGKIWLMYYTENVLPKKIKQMIENLKRVYQNL